TLYAWDNQAATFEVTSTAACTGGFTLGPTTVVPRTAPSSWDIMTRVCSGTTVSNIILDFEFYRPDGTREAQQIVSFIRFAAGVPLTLHRIFDATIPPVPPPGTYTVKVGVCPGDWVTLYAWDNQAATFVVE